MLTAKVVQGVRTMHAPSSILRSLRSIGWLPNASGLPSLASDLFAPRGEVKAVFGATVDYLAGMVSVEAERALQLRALPFDDLVYAIECWKRHEAWPSLADLCRVYEYMAWRARDDAAAMAERLHGVAWIVIPASSGAAAASGMAEEEEKEHKERVAREGPREVRMTLAEVQEKCREYGSGGNCAAGHHQRATRGARVVWGRGTRACNQGLRF